MVVTVKMVVDKQVSDDTHSRLSRVLTSLIDIWDDIRGLLLSNS